MFFALKAVLDKVVGQGDLLVNDAKGRQYRFGDGGEPHVEIRLKSPLVERELAFDPELNLGQTYMNGGLELRQGSIYDLLTILMRRRVSAHAGWLKALDKTRIAMRRVRQLNTTVRAQRNVAHHYDIDDSIYQLFLDSDRQYSCAYFTPGAGLEEAQLAKKRHIAAKLALKPGLRVLDIGCGWGGLALYLAANGGVDVTGITLSREQLAVARRRGRELHLDGQVRFENADYRKIAGPFDRVVSVGMFEHVGVNHYRTYFKRVHDLLTNDGVALIHTIARSDGPGYTNPFIDRYIFPGGYFPAHSEIMAAIEKSNLLVTDVEVLRLHYAHTLRAWRERFVANWARAVAIRGEEFARMWEFYLAGSEAGFRLQGLIVVQVQLAKHVDALPMTRDYMAAAERRLALAEGGDIEQPRLAGE